ncbi:D-serine ammonia-lyase [Isachenkonia alkalipeptolytica]|uniref:Probable D-serine dehydratase n=1 Tax=Isachenkonia alkalipeptolytica TaxID=2565777 RepID=A0AA44BEY9_9CLOT|nr:D-serine ammonia-lyase [Isachenkonia alkalipeptolytica]NBG89458.1 D-serine ammonia-lyase [Isachenkonia alkalipeptolytica]
MKEMMEKITELQPVVWENPNKKPAEKALEGFNLKMEDILEAEERLQRFAPLIYKYFPETEDGIIESPFQELPGMKEWVEKSHAKKIKGKLYGKCDNQLKIAGSIKARGGIYEVLKFAETIALENQWITLEDNYEVLGEEQYRSRFSRYKIAVGSTGNLGLSIGIISATLGFEVTVHMSRDAKPWKKDLLREKGAKVVEYTQDYGKAVEEGRKACLGDEKAHFIDDENSKDLFLGYSVAALRLKGDLAKENIMVDEKHPLRVYLPCGVGGAPGGIAFGLKTIFKDGVQCYYVEPTHAPCMLLGLITGEKEKLHINEYGIDNITEADGLAVGRPSKMVSELSDTLIDGGYTLEDENLLRLMQGLYTTEKIKTEPSAAAGLLGPVLWEDTKETTHIAWLTGGDLIPEEAFRKLLNTKGN